MPFLLTKSAVPLVVNDFSGSIAYDTMIWNFTFSLPKTAYDLIDYNDTLVFSLGAKSIILKVTRKSRSVTETRALGTHNIECASEFMTPYGAPVVFGRVLEPFEKRGDGEYSLETVCEAIPQPSDIATFSADGTEYELILSSVTLGAQKNESGLMTHVRMSVGLTNALPVPPLRLQAYQSIGGKGSWLCRHYPGRATLLEYKPAPDPQDPDPPYFDELFADIGTVSRVLPQYLQAQGLSGLATYTEQKTEILVFQNSASAGTEFPIISLVGSQVIYAKNLSGSTVTPDIYAHNGSVQADMPFIGAVVVTYQTTFTYFVYAPRCDGCFWPSESDFGTVFMAFGTQIASEKIPAIPLEMAGDIPLWQVTTTVLVDSSNGYDYATATGSEWEVPVDWPQNLDFGGGLGLAPDEEDASVETRVVQRAYLRQGTRVLDPPEGWWENKRPYVGVMSYKPRFQYAQAAPPSEPELLSLYNRYDFEGDIDQLTNASSFFYQYLYDVDGNLL